VVRRRWVVFLTEMGASPRMPRMKFRGTNGLLLTIALMMALAGCAGSGRREPGNLTALKAELIRYQESGDYERGLDAVAREASRWIEARAARKGAGERLAVVFDVDETVLSNWENMMRDDFGYVSERWHAWVERTAATAIEPVRETYLTARRTGVAVIFLTGRKEKDRAATERNLVKAGLGNFEALIVRPSSGERVSAVEFKTAVRKRLVDDGWTIVANVGDQESDLAGGYAEKTFKLPNPFYITE
jgi:predicted secreted acid phosphatase